MDMQLYKRVQDVVNSLSIIEENQNKKLDEVLKQLTEIKQLLTIKPKVIEPKVQELSKVKVKK